MEVPRRPRSEGSYSPRHSTGGFLGSRSARVVAAGLTVSLGVVGAVALAERTAEPPAVQAAPGLSAAPSSPASSPAPSSSLPAGPSASPSAPSVAAAGEPTPERVEDVGDPTADQAVGQGADQAVGQGADQAVGQGADPSSAAQGTRDRRAPRAPVPARTAPVAAPTPSAPSSPPAPEPSTPPVTPPAADPSVVAPAERFVLVASAPLPGDVQLPPRSLQVRLPGPDPVEVTGSVTSPEPGRVDVTVTVDPGPRHVAEDPAPETDGVLAAAVQRVARHSAAPAGQTPVVP